MFQRIVVPLDGSREAERAIPVAARLARASGGSIVFVRVVLPPVDLGKYAARHSVVWERNAYQAERAEAAAYLAGTIFTYASDLSGIETEIGVASGLIPPTICSVARTEQADLIVMCSHGETGLPRWLFGSVTQEVARQSSVPVLALHARGGSLPTPHAAHPLRVVVVLDGSPLSEMALRPAVELLVALALPAQGTLHLLQVIDRPVTGGKWRGQAYIDAVMQEQIKRDAEMKMVADYLLRGHLKARGLAITWSVAVSTDIAGTIIQQAKDSEKAGHGDSCNLIVTAIHGKRGLRHLMRGRVAEHILSTTRLPLLMVRPHETATQAHL